MISDTFPTDLILEILLRLPAKSITRFHCVSKLWASMLSSPHFTELFLTRSSAHPRLLFAIEKHNQWSFFSLPQHQSPYEKSSSSLVVAADIHMKFPPDIVRIYPCRDRPCAYASGLIYFYGMRIKQKGYNFLPVICNPIMGQYAALPSLETYRESFSYFGFDPVDKEFKVLFMANAFSRDHHKILTLGTGNMKWRMIKCSLTHNVVSNGICTNGVLYYLGYMSKDYLGYTLEEMPDYVIVCFDVRSEKFKIIYPESYCKLINYKGRLGVIYNGVSMVMPFELRMWVLEDVEKQEWSKLLDVIINTLINYVIGLHKSKVVIRKKHYNRLRL